MLQPASRSAQAGLRRCRSPPTGTRPARTRRAPHSEVARASWPNGRCIVVVVVLTPLRSLVSIYSYQGKFRLRHLSCANSVGATGCRLGRAFSSPFPPMRTPECRRTVSAIVAGITALTMTINIAVLLINLSIELCLAVFGANLLAALGIAGGLWRLQHLQQHNAVDAPAATPNVRSVVPPIPVESHGLAAVVAPRSTSSWLCCLPRQSVPPPAAPRPSAALPSLKEILPRSCTAAVVCELVRCTRTTNTPFQDAGTPCHLLVLSSQWRAPPLSSYIEQLDAKPLGIRFPLLRMRTTGEPCLMDSLMPTLAFWGAALRRAEPLVVLFDCTATGKLVAPTWACLRYVGKSVIGRRPRHSLSRVANHFSRVHVLDPRANRQIHLWANANAAKWDTYGQGVAVWMTSEVMRPILQLATRILKPPQVCSCPDALPSACKHECPRSVCTVCVRAAPSVPAHCEGVLTLTPHVPRMCADSHTT